MNVSWRKVGLGADATERIAQPCCTTAREGEEFGVDRHIGSVECRPQLSPKWSTCHAQASHRGQSGDTIPTNRYPIRFSRPGSILLLRSPALRAVLRPGTFKTLEEATGLIRWLRPEYQAPNAVPVTVPLIGLEAVASPPSPTRKVPSPTALPEQRRAVKDPLRAILLQTPAELARNFRPAPRTRIAEIIESLPNWARPAKSATASPHSKRDYRIRTPGSLSRERKQPKKIRVTSELNQRSIVP